MKDLINIEDLLGIYLAPVGGNAQGEASLAVDDAGGSSGKKPEKPKEKTTKEKLDDLDKAYKKRKISYLKFIEQRGALENQARRENDTREAEAKLDSITPEQKKAYETVKQNEGQERANSYLSSVAPNKKEQMFNFSLGFLPGVSSFNRGTDSGQVAYTQAIAEGKSHEEAAKLRDQTILKKTGENLGVEGLTFGAGKVGKAGLDKLAKSEVSRTFSDVTKNTIKGAAGQLKTLDNEITKKGTTGMGQYIFNVSEKALKRPGKTALTLTGKNPYGALNLLRGAGQAVANSIVKTTEEPVSEYSTNTGQLREEKKPTVNTPSTPTKPPITNSWGITLGNEIPGWQPKLDFYLPPQMREEVQQKDSSVKSNGNVVVNKSVNEGDDFTEGNKTHRSTENKKSSYEPGNESSGFDNKDVNNRLNLSDYDVNKTNYENAKWNQAMEQQTDYSVSDQRLKIFSTAKRDPVIKRMVTTIYERSH